MRLSIMDKEAYGKMVNIWNSLKITLAMMCTQMERPSTYPGVGNVQGVWDKLYL